MKLGIKSAAAAGKEAVTDDVPSVSDWDEFIVVVVDEIADYWADSDEA